MCVWVFICFPLSLVCVAVYHWVCSRSCYSAAASLSVCYCYSVSCCLPVDVCVNACLQCVCVCVCGTVEHTDIALCPRYIWVTTLSVFLLPLSFSPLSAPIPASVHSTRLMVCVIHSDSFTTSHLFVLSECVAVCVCTG